MLGKFQRRGVLLIWIIVGEGSTALAVGAGVGYLAIFVSHLSFLTPLFLSLGDGWCWTTFSTGTSYQPGQ